ncbi:MAG: HD-GYP domain-containing protein [Acetivibrio ethanolgignens]
MLNNMGIELLEEEEFEYALQEDFKSAIKHGILVSRLVALVGKELRETEDFMEEMLMASMLHDIGKLRLSKYLYGRVKGALDIEEMKYMRRHAKYSYEIVKEAGFNEMIQKIIYHHHENYDGSGYPDNLVGETIPLGARILRVCDMFCALVSNRPYRAAFDVDTAMEMMIDEIKNFDMCVFLAFQRVINSREFEQVDRIISYVNAPETDKPLINLYAYIKEFEEEKL